MPLLGRPFLKPAADPLNPPAHQPNPAHQLHLQPHPCLSRCQEGSTRQPPPAPSLCPLFFFAWSCGRSTQPVRQAGDAMGAPAERLARRGPERAHREPDPTEGGGNKDLNAPTARIRGRGKRPPRDPPAPSRRTAGGIGEIRPGLLVVSFQKGARKAWHGCQATNPFGVFHSPSPLLAPAWRKEEAHRRRVVPGKGGAGGRAGAGTSTSPGCRRHAKDVALNHRSWEGEKAVHVGERSRTGAGTLTSPGTPTSPRHRPSSTRLRLHRCPNVSTTADAFPFPPSLSSSLFSTDGVGVRRRVAMPGCRPSSRSTSASRSCGALRPPMPLGPPTPCEDHL
jgi:hypothetical protein